MITLVVDPQHPDATVIARAAELIRAGSLVAFPTETVYGLGADATNVQAVARIFAAKERPSFNPLIVHVANEERARELVSHWPPEATALAREFWPGPLTMVLPKRATIPDLVTAGLSSVAVRVPAHPVALALTRAAEVPIAAPSANRFTELSATSAPHVAKSLGNRVDLLLDGGPTSVGIESTVIDLSGVVPILLRPGGVSAAALEGIVGRLGVLPAPFPGDAPRPSPGMIERHYAPRARLQLVSSGEIETAYRRLIETSRAEVIGLLTFQPPSFAPSTATTRVMPRDPAEFARLLYATLHELDDLGCEVLLIERVPASGGWEAIDDRLSRAATDLPHQTGEMS